MKCEIWDTVTDRPIRIDEHATPVCGEDFCDNCGDCLACTGAEDPCYVSQDGFHRWIRYVTPSGERQTTPDREFLDRMYRDQQPDGDGVFVVATYTPWGIRLLDTRFCRDIMATKTVEGCLDITKRLQADHHLHRVIKRNLFLNLHRTIRHLQGVDGVG